jgi:hypothetical protein
MEIFFNCLILTGTFIISSVFPFIAVTYMEAGYGPTWVSYNSAFRLHLELLSEIPVTFTIYGAVVVQSRQAPSEVIS